MISFPNAKINLGLQVLRRRGDGFHDIETVFYPVALHDSLEIIPAPGNETTIAHYGIPVPGDDDLCLKACALLREDHDLSPVTIHLLKGIPVGAGLGGGSSDAAHTLRILNNMFSLGLDDAALEQLAAKLGSDCPFFIRNRPVLATGRGEVFEGVDIDLAGKLLLLADPGIHISSREAYAMVSPAAGRPSLRDIIKTPIGEWKDILVNDFEKTVFSLYPRIRELRDRMYGAGAVYASMSGSGSVVYGIFDSDGRDALALEQEMRPLFAELAAKMFFIPLR